MFCFWPLFLLAFSGCGNNRCRRDCIRRDRDCDDPCRRRDDDDFRDPCRRCDDDPCRRRRCC